MLSKKRDQNLTSNLSICSRKNLIRPSNSNDALSSSNVLPMQCALPGSSTHGVEASIGEPSGDPGIRKGY